MSRVSGGVWLGGSPDIHNELNLAIKGGEYTLMTNL